MGGVKVEEEQVEGDERDLPAELIEESGLATARVHRSLHALVAERAVEREAEPVALVVAEHPHDLGVVAGEVGMRLHPAA
jgi:DNA-binding IclR family transcriptional regulator